MLPALAHLRHHARRQKPRRASERPQLLAGPARRDSRFPDMPIRIVIAEDNYLVREGALRLLGGELD